MNDTVLQEQIAYYRARAHEYEELLPPSPAPGIHLLQQMGPFQQVLELACGTGSYTQALLSIGHQVTAVDAVPEMLEINTRTVANARVRYQLADLFTWEPDQQYDLVFCASWLSHVPPDALDAFLDKVRRAARPGGHLVLVDQYAPKKEERLKDDIYATRRISDGRTFTIVKVFYDVTTLEDRLTRLGFEVVVHQLNDVWFFLSGRRGERRMASPQKARV